MHMHTLTLIPAHSDTCIHTHIPSETCTLPEAEEEGGDEEEREMEGPPSGLNAAASVDTTLG
jgi:hypothetical protein